MRKTIEELEAAVRDAQDALDNSTPTTRLCAGCFLEDRKHDLRERRCERENVGGAAIIAFILTLILVAAVAGCANTPDAAWYAQGFVAARTGPQALEACSDENAGIRIGREYRVKKNWRVAGEYEHVSHLACGKPFNNAADESTSHVGVTVTYGGLH